MRIVPKICNTNLCLFLILQDMYAAFFLPAHNTHKGIPLEREEWMDRTMAQLIKDRNALIILPYLSGFAIHPCFPPLWQVTVPLSLLSVICLKPLASSQHRVRVCVYVGGCVCVRVFFLSV